MDALPAPGEILALSTAIGTVLGALIGLLLADPTERLRDEIIAGGTLGGIAGVAVGLAVVGGGALAGVA